MLPEAPYRRVDGQGECYMSGRSTANQRIEPRRGLFRKEIPQSLGPAPIAKSLIVQRNGVYSAVHYKKNLEVIRNKSMDSPGFGLRSDVILPKCMCRKRRKAIFTHSSNIGQRGLL